MLYRSLASKEGLAKLAIVSCLSLTQFACDETTSVEVQTIVSEQVGRPHSSVSGKVSKGLVLDLAVDREYFDSGKLALIATLKNGSADEISFLPWASPFEKKVTAHFLTIIDLNTGVELPYRGLMVKRMPPKPSDYQSLAPQKTIRNTIDISTSYKFCGHQKLKIAFSGALYNRLSIPYKLESNNLELVLSDAFPDC